MLRGGGSQVWAEAPAEGRYIDFVAITASKHTYTETKIFALRRTRTDYC